MFEFYVYRVESMCIRLLDYLRPDLYMEIWVCDISRRVGNAARVELASCFHVLSGFCLQKNPINLQ